MSAESDSIKTGGQILIDFIEDRITPLVVGGITIGIGDRTGTIKQAVSNSRWQARQPIDRVYLHTAKVDGALLYNVTLGHSGSTDDSYLLEVSQNGAKVEEEVESLDGSAPNYEEPPNGHALAAALVALLRRLERSGQLTWD